MKLYVCWGTWQPAPRPGGKHPCGLAHKALVDAGHAPEVVKTYGLGLLPSWMNPPGRKEVERLSGDQWVPLLVLDDGTQVKGSETIVDWARSHPA